MATKEPFAAQEKQTYPTYYPEFRIGISAYPVNLYLISHNQVGKLVFILVNDCFQLKTAAVPGKRMLGVLNCKKWFSVARKMPLYIFLLVSNKCIW